MLTLVFALFHRVISDHPLYLKKAVHRDVNHEIASGVCEPFCGTLILPNNGDFEVAAVGRMAIGVGGFAH